MKVMLLGVKGMLGQELLKKFSFEHEVCGLDRDEIDITDKKMLAQKMVEIQPQIVINAAAYNAVDKIEENNGEFEKAININGEAVGSLAHLCKVRGTVLVHYSSDYVFKGNNPTGYSEDERTDPINKYGFSKELGEKLLREKTDKYYIIRLSKLFGKPGATEGAKKSFVDTMIWLATDGGKTHIDLVNEEMSSPTYAPDLAAFTKEILDSNKPFGIYHGANSGACSWYEFGKAVFKLKNLNIEVNAISGEKYIRPALRPFHSELLNTKMPLQRSWQKALEEYLK